MSATREQWIVAAAIYGVEALKDQGICRWNYSLMLLHQHAKNNLIKSFSEAKVPPSTPPSLLPVAAAGSDKRREEEKKYDKSIKKVMELSSWGPSTVRF
ncbi:hypothetical protein CCACVL1_12955 [Corchorus capsularis]|uniref:Wound-responsive family protein n=1 Tax=Corchorus capsularis TaxID=210143 RepID=A0A1R3ID05_COCAP|nr:hypothetical protein CCACVL1_12955 [Corchorus capsularis]